MTELLATIGGIAIFWWVYKTYAEWARERQARENPPYARGIRAIEDARARGGRHYCFGPDSSGDHYGRRIYAVAGPGANRKGVVSMLCAECAREEGWPETMGLFGAAARVAIFDAVDPEPEPIPDVGAAARVAIFDAVDPEPEPIPDPTGWSCEDSDETNSPTFVSRCICGETLDHHIVNSHGIPKCADLIHEFNIPERQRHPIRPILPEIVAALMRDTYGRAMYIELANGLSTDENFLADADPDSVAAAAEFASRLGVEWPPHPEVNVALDAVQRAERSDR